MYPLPADCHEHGYCITDEVLHQRVNNGSYQLLSSIHSLQACILVMKPMLGLTIDFLGLSFCYANLIGIRLQFCTCNIHKAMRA